MGDYGAEWEAQRAAALVEWEARVAVVLGELADRYVELLARIDPGLVAAATGGTGGTSSGRPPGSRVPVDVDAFDLVVDVERFVVHFAPLVRGALRLGLVSTSSQPGGKRARRVRDWLGFAADNLGAVWNEDPVLAEDLADRGWRLRNRAGGILGVVPRAFPIGDPCPDCGDVSLWVVPDRMVVRCRRADCGREVPVSVAVPLWSSVTGDDGPTVGPSPVR